MDTYDYVSGATPSTWTFASTPSTSFVLLPHAAAVTVAGVAQPIFGYYGYATSGPLALSGTSYATPLVAADAAATAKVTITFEAQPSDGSFTAANANAKGEATDFTDSVVLRLAPASTASGSTNTPCT